MNKAEWLACDEPRRMLDYVEVYHRAARTRQGRRRLRLLACACCRRLWHLAEGDKGRRAVEVAERYADGLASKEELRAARETDERGDNFWRWAAQYAVKEKPQEATDSMALFSFRHRGASGSEEYRAQCALVRDLFGNPFRPVALEPAWLAWHRGAAVKLAQAVHEERQLPSGHLDTARLAVLADMLEEAGCSDPELLPHLRSPGPHVRGCWAVDLILSKDR